MATHTATCDLHKLSLSLSHPHTGCLFLLLLLLPVSLNYCHLISAITTHFCATICPLCCLALSLSLSLAACLIYCACSLSFCFFLFTVFCRISISVCNCHIGSHFQVNYLLGLGQLTIACSVSVAMIYKCAKHMSLSLTSSFSLSLSLSCSFSSSACTANLFIAQIAQLFGRWASASLGSKWLSFVFVSWKAATTAPTVHAPSLLLYLSSKPSQTSVDRSGNSQSNS